MQIVGLLVTGIRRLPPFAI